MNIVYDLSFISKDFKVVMLIKNGNRLLCVSLLCGLIFKSWASVESFPAFAIPKSSHGLELNPEYAEPEKIFLNTDQAGFVGNDCNIEVNRGDTEDLAEKAKQSDG